MSHHGLGRDEKPPESRGKREAGARPGSGSGQVAKVRVEREAKEREPDLSPAQKRAAFSRARTVLSGLRELNLAANIGSNDDSPEEVQKSKTLDERLELQRWRSVEDSYLRAKRNWRKAREFVLATKQVKKQGGAGDRELGREPLKEQLRRWSTRLALRDEVWLEFTLGSLRAECLLLADTMLVFCARCGTGRVQLAADAFSRAAGALLARLVSEV
ncbi:hypothetical protein AK812_SmicGene43810 [Symbiodinium microadriaticum]|uniref:Uncharacterized protein n=1 Tax=Symbiodinium microadriaticum TaxID=2951 RepID=A0A1Q9C026_SYMMI|nr:hypothetical protein AK812_SmicGene43810 [Symbiodinium microadriaticum]